MSTEFDFDKMYDQAMAADTAIPADQPAMVLTQPDLGPDPEQAAVREFASNVVAVSRDTVIPTPLAEKRKQLSFNQPVTLVPVLTEEGKKKFITRKKVIDKYNTKCERIELTPSVCQICAFDVSLKYFGSWHQSPVSERPKLMEALQKHIEIAHPLSNASIIDEDQLPKRWLGNNKF